MLNAGISRWSVVIPFAQRDSDAKKKRAPARRFITGSGASSAD